MSIEQAVKDFIKEAVAAGMLVAVFQPAHAGEFMSSDTYRARIAEANDECDYVHKLGGDKSGCVSAYLCSNYGDCDGERMQPIEPLPGGGVYRDNVGGSENG